MLSHPCKFDKKEMKDDSHTPPSFPPQPSQSPSNTPLIKPFHRMHYICSLPTPAHLDIAPRRSHSRPIALFLLPATYAVLGPIRLSLSLSLGANLGDLRLEVVDLRCAACVCAFKEAFVGQEFGGVEGANVGEGLVEL